MSLKFDQLFAGLKILVQLDSGKKFVCEITDYEGVTNFGPVYNLSDGAMLRNISDVLNYSTDSDNELATVTPFIAEIELTPADVTQQMVGNEIRIQIMSGGNTSSIAGKLNFCSDDPNSVGMDLNDYHFISDNSSFPFERCFAVDGIWVIKGARGASVDSVKIFLKV